MLRQFIPLHRFDTVFVRLALSRIGSTEVDNGEEAVVKLPELFIGLEGVTFSLRL